MVYIVYRTEKEEGSDPEQIITIGIGSNKITDPSGTLIIPSVIQARLSLVKSRNGNPHSFLNGQIFFHDIFFGLVFPF
jgi:hypothetical protein